jgi:hypothetical protein
MARSETVDAAVAQTDLDLAADRDDELSAWRGVPVQEMASFGTAKDDAFCFLQRAEVWMRLERLPLDVGLPVVASVEA